MVIIMYLRRYRFNSYFTPPPPSVRITIESSGSLTVNYGVRRVRVSVKLLWAVDMALVVVLLLLLLLNTGVCRLKV